MYLTKIESGCLIENNKFTKSRELWYKNLLHATMTLGTGSTQGKKIRIGKEQTVNGALGSNVSTSAHKREYSHFYIQLKRQIWVVQSLSLSLGASSLNTSFLEFALVRLGV